VKKPAKAAVPARKAAPKKKVAARRVSPKVKAARHATAVKAAKSRAANLKKHPRRRLALGEGVACCSAEALAASLRLAGWPVSDADVLALYRRTAADLDAGASILATLEAAAEYGLAGCQVAAFASADLATYLPSGVILGLALPAPHAVLDTGSEWITWGQAWPARAFPDAVLEEAWVIEWEGGE
jgi:hypothetical protein